MAEYTTLEQVKIRLKQFHIDSESSEVVFEKLEENPLLELLLEQNQNLIINISGISDSKKEEYLKKKEDAIVELALYDRNKLGADYSSSYSENGISRVWNSKEEILNYYGICWHVKCF